MMKNLRNSVIILTLFLLVQNSSLSQTNCNDFADIINWQVEVDTGLYFLRNKDIDSIQNSPIEVFYKCNYDIKEDVFIYLNTEGFRACNCNSSSYILLDNVKQENFEVINVRLEVAKDLCFETILERNSSFNYIYIRISLGLNNIVIPEIILTEYLMDNW